MGPNQIFAVHVRSFLFFGPGFNREKANNVFTQSETLSVFFGILKSFQLPFRGYSSNGSLYNVWDALLLALVFLVETRGPTQLWFW